jgi:dihydrolipoamide dehydrogenase
MSIITGTKVGSVDPAGKTVRVGGDDIQADMVLLAVGRKPVLPEGVDDVGVKHDKSGILVDSRMKTSVHGIYAVGDVASELKLAHVAYATAEAAARNIMGETYDMDYTVVPWCVFTLPEVARVGITEKEANWKVRVGKADYISNGKARCMGERTGFCKVIVDDKTDVVVGVHIVGAHASDLIGEATLAVREALTAREIAATIHPHPTLTEVLREACANACL